MAGQIYAGHSRCYDAIVVGAGIQGLFAAYQLAKRGQKTLLLEQFPLPHTRGSSQGQSRIIRSAYPQDYYILMMGEAYRLWAALEAEAGVKLYRPTPMLVLGHQENPKFQNYRQSIERHHIPSEAFTPQALAQKFSGFYPHGGEMAVSDLSAGVLYANKALQAVQPLRISVCYWKAKGQGHGSHRSLEQFPCFLSAGLSGHAHDVYGLPSDEYPGLVKICYHHGSPVDPDQPDQLGHASAVPDVRILQDFVRKYLPGLEPEPAVQERCLYTNTPDEDFVLDRHPRFRNIIIGAGFSGHGFKFAPVIGKILCELSLGEEPFYNLAPFQISRFSTPSKANL
ncbi:peroxisomal sarcosine oxidase isoform X2 [Hemicordylus capensis]|uniref:peroxisomal sarcosine oxidase isoform X2 n=1 Tax=Hemicordylus capensis TaxID=884348 RepID=UPI002304023F|nr:peroxisomal sarcosine oxidase isoform X2 [Hemicordylus capensis]